MEGDDRMPSNVQKQTNTVDVVVPVYNEEDTIEVFHQQLSQIAAELTNDFTFYYINDGSNDHTQEKLEYLASVDSRVVVIELTRNFGHQAALTAGLDVSGGDIVITMDGDGQHPPSLIPEMLSLSQAGYDIVLTKRIEERRTSLPKRWTSAAFYWILNKISDTDIEPGVADFRMMSREAVDALISLREYHRFLRGMTAWIGYQTVIIPFIPPERLGGRSKYSLNKMVKLAMDAGFSFSLVPLYIGFFVGLMFLVLAFAEIIYVSSFWLSGKQDSLVPGWSSLMFMLLFVGGTLLTLLGLVGVYIGHIFQEVKRRPVYIVKRSGSKSAQIQKTEDDS